MNFPQVYFLILWLNGILEAFKAETNDIMPLLLLLMGI